MFKSTLLATTVFVTYEHYAGQVQ